MRQRYIRLDAARTSRCWIAGRVLLVRHAGHDNGWGTLGEGTQNLDGLGCHIAGRLEGPRLKIPSGTAGTGTYNDICRFLCSAPVPDWPVLCGHGCRGWQGDLGQERGRAREQPGRVRGALAGDAGRGVGEERGQQRAGRLAGAQEC